MDTELHRFFPPFHLDRVNAQLWRGEEKPPTLIRRL